MVPSKQDLWHFITDENGVTLIEYAAAASLIAIVCVATLVALGGSVSLFYTRLCQEVSTAVSGAPGC